jgi:tyrosine-protein kinase Etk/Wzc
MTESASPDQPTRTPVTDSSAASPAAAREVDLLDLLIVLVRHKKVLIGLPFVVGILAIAITYSLPDVYTGAAKILPPQQNQSAASLMLSQLTSGAGGVGGFVGALPIKNPSDLYVGMLKSRTVADVLISRFDLRKRYQQNLQSGARGRLESRTTITAGKEGIILIEVDDYDPKFAAALANGYVDELINLTQVLAVSEASQRRLFFEQQLMRAKENLIQVEDTARRSLQGGLVKIDDQGRAMVETTARLRAQMSSKEIQIGAMRTFAAEDNPELHRAEKELEAMRRELSRLECSSVVAGGRDSAAGGKGLDNLRLLRDMKYNEILYELLAKQYEVARIDDPNRSARLSVLRRAIGLRR